MQDTMIKAVFLDFDGTVYSHRYDTIPKNTVKALKRLNEKGILTFLCTGRAPIELEWFDLSKINLTGMILSNGQVVFNDKKEIIYEKAIEGKLKEELIRIYNEKRIPIYLATRDEVILNYLADIVVKVQNAVSSNIPQVKPYNDKNFYMASVFVENKEYYDEVMKLQDIAEITYWHQGACDIVPKGVSKTVGIDETLKLYDIDISQTLAIGDGENDIGMLKHCAIGIAMGNSPDYVKEVADYITEDIDDDGLYKALKHFELI